LAKEKRLAGANQTSESNQASGMNGAVQVFEKLPVIRRFVVAGGVEMVTSVKLV
jgi:hypothetical protein